MKLKYTGPFGVDIPALGMVGVESGAELDVTDEATAASLLLQGYEPVDKEAKDLLKKVTTPEPVAAPEPPKEA